MRRSILADVLLLTVLCAPTVKAVEPDFYLVMKQCSTTVGYLVLSSESLKTVQGEPVTNVCTRRGKAVSCQLSFQGESNGLQGNSANYTISIDSPPLLLFSDGLAGDWIMVDTVKHAAVIITRVVDKQFAGAKVCQGIFATQSEMDALKKK